MHYSHQSEAELKGYTKDQPEYWYLYVMCQISAYQKSFDPEQVIQIDKYRDRHNYFIELALTGHDRTDLQDLIDSAGIVGDFWTDFDWFE